MDWEIANEPWYTEEDVDVQSANDRDRDSDSASDSLTPYLPPRRPLVLPHRHATNAAEPEHDHSQAVDPVDEPWISSQDAARRDRVKDDDEQRLISSEEESAEDEADDKLFRPPRASPHTLRLFSDSFRL
ncbi:hypothetical protein LTR66_002301 [Elasticomyces elasticus]|nr:hypothetical protein LTR66_002301 [Elasticomyces elasticus]